MKRRTLLAFSGAMLSLAPTLSNAQTAYPTKPIRLLVGFPPGQATDTIARLLGEKLARNLGQPVVVENRPGQGGSAALANLTQQPPDGYALAMAATGAAVTNQYLQKKLPYKSDDFQAVGLIGDLPLLLVARPQLPFNDVKGLIAYAKKNPGKLSYSSPGNGTTSHLAMESLKREAGIHMVHIPYQGSVRSLTDLMGGQVDVSFDTIPVTQQHILGGKMKLLAVGHRERMPAFPEAATLAESGFPQLIASVWLGVLAPKATPMPVVERINTEIASTLREPEFTKKLQEMGVIVRHEGPAAFAGMIAKESPLWKKIVELSGATVD